MEFAGNKAIYLQIVDYIFEQILQFQWPAEMRIPAVRELAMTLTVNPNTIMRSYNFLEDKNIIYTQRGIGYFLTPKARERALALKKSEFMHEVLPKIFQTMDLLDLNLDEIKQLYKKRKRHEKK